MKKKIKNVVFTLLFLTGGISVVFLAYLHFFASDDKDLSGEWTADLDMTEQAAIAAFSWLQDIEGVSVSLEEIEDCMQGLTVQVNLTFEPTSRREGTFHCMVVQESYDACTQAAYGAFAAAFRELLAGAACHGRLYGQYGRGSHRGSCNRNIWDVHGCLSDVLWPGAVAASGRITGTL